MAAEESGPTKGLDEEGAAAETPPQTSTEAPEEEAAETPRA